MNRHSHWSDQLGQAQRPAFQAGRAVRACGVATGAARSAAVPVWRPAFQAGAPQWVVVGGPGTPNILGFGR